MSMGPVGGADSPRTLRVLHCTEVSQSMSQMGHERPICRVRAMSASPPTATELLHYSNRRFGPLATDAPQQMASLFDHVVGKCEKRRRYFEAERFGSLEVYNELEFRRL